MTRSSLALLFSLALAAPAAAQAHDTRRRSASR